MSFFKENRTAGIALIILGVINLIGALAALVGVFTAKDIIVSAAVSCIGPIIMAVLYFRFGMSIKHGSISKKIDILAYFVRLAGLESIIVPIFNLWNAWENAGGLIAISGLIISIIIGLIILAVSSRINDGKQDTLDKVIWIILVVLFAISAIINVWAVISVFIDGKLTLDLGILDNVSLPIVNVIIATFMLCALFDSDVQREMNM